MARSHSPAPYDENLGLLRKLLQQAKLVMRLMGDPRVPLLAKALPIFSTAYLISPVDFVSGAVFPVIGAMDDIAIVLLGYKLFLEFCPPEVVAEHEAALAGQYVDAENTVEGEVRAVDEDAEPAAGPVIDIDT